MELERQNTQPAPRGMSTPAKVVLGALAIFGAIVMVQWLLAALLGIVKWGLFVVIVVAVAAWVVGAKGSR